MQGGQSIQTTEYIYDQSNQYNHSLSYWLHSYFNGEVGVEGISVTVISKMHFPHQDVLQSHAWLSNL